VDAIPAPGEGRRRSGIAAILIAGAVLLVALALTTFEARAGDGKKDAGSKAGSVQCEMTFNVKGWSAFYKTSKGDGTIKCDNGQSMKVKIKATGGGLTFGKSETIGGTGKFSGAASINDLLGAYAQSEAHAGAGKSADAQALTKGEIHLTLVGTGKGVDVGFAFGKFTIEKV
jgi:hypothetical protein